MTELPSQAEPPLPTLTCSQQPNAASWGLLTAMGIVTSGVTLVCATNAQQVHSKVASP